MIVDTPGFGANNINEENKYKFIFQLFLEANLLPLRHIEDMVKVFRDDLKFINVFVILFKETDMRLDKVRVVDKLHNRR